MAKKLIVIGKNNLNNTLLVSYIEKHTNYPTHVVDVNKHIIKRKEDIDSADLVLIDCNSCDSEKVDNLLHELSSRQKNDGVLHIALFNISNHSNTEHFAQQANVKGLFPEDIPIKKFITGIKSIFDGELWLSRKLLSKMFLNLKQNSEPRVEEFSLTRRETEIIKLVALGNRNNDIANILSLSPHTVKTHIYNIYKKLNIENRMQVVNWANHYWSTST